MESKNNLRGAQIVRVDRRILFLIFATGSVSSIFDGKSVYFLCGSFYDYYFKTFLFLKA